MDEAKPKIQWEKEWSMTYNKLGKKEYDWITADRKWKLTQTGYYQRVGKFHPTKENHTSWTVTNLETGETESTVHTNLVKAKAYVQSKYNDMQENFIKDAIKRIQDRMNCCPVFKHGKEDFTRSEIRRMVNFLNKEKNVKTADILAFKQGISFQMGSGFSDHIDIMKTGNTYEIHGQGISKTIHKSLDDVMSRIKTLRW